MSIALAVFAGFATGCGGTWQGHTTSRYGATPSSGSTVEIVDLPSAPPAGRPILAHAQRPTTARAGRAGAANRAAGASGVRYESMTELGSYVPGRGDHDHDHAASAHASTSRGATSPVVESAASAAYGPQVTAEGIGFPYPTAKFFRGFGRCIRGQSHVHEAIDLGGVGPDWGVGTPIRSMGRAEIVFIGLGTDNPELFGAPDTRRGHVLRGRKELPRHAVIAPYGDVYFFTKTKGRWRSGNIIVTRVIDGPLAGHIVRYLHVAAVHPAVRTGVVVERGQEIALMGGTGVQESAPHLHLDIETPDGRRVDVAPVLGLAKTASCEDISSEIGELGDTSAADAKVRKYARVPTTSRSSDKKASRDEVAQEEREDEDAEDVGKVWVQRVAHDCKGQRWDEDFASGRYDSHAIVLSLQKGEKLDLAMARTKGKWKPAISYSGARLKKKPGRAKRGQTRLVLQATADTEVTLKVEAKKGGQPPKDAGYSLVFGSTCTAARGGR